MTAIMNIKQKCLAVRQHANRRFQCLIRVTIAPAIQYFQLLRVLNSAAGKECDRIRQPRCRSTFLGAE